jgi:hypothetical protein
MLTIHLFEPVTVKLRIFKPIIFYKLPCISRSGNYEKYLQ